MNKFGDYTFKKDLANNNKAELTICAQYKDYYLELLDECKGKIIDESWTSKYNAFVTYEKEPFVVEGFLYTATIDFYTVGHLEFFNYLLERKLKQISDLELNYKTELEVS